MEDYSVKELTDRITEFCKERDWDQYHNPKDLAIGIVTEAGELLDLFRFKNEEETAELLHDQEKRQHVEEELADILFFAFRFASFHGMDVREILYNKIRKNAENYPVEKAKGSNKKYNEL